jgi:Cu(I)/Ag(I) efflux system membrane fusion protein
MTLHEAPVRRRRAVVYVALAAVAALLAFLLRGPLTAWFTDKPMGETKSEQVSTQAGGLTVGATLQPDPPRQEGNSLLLDVTGADGKPLEEAQVTIGYVMPAMGSMSKMRGKATVADEGEGRYRADFDLPMTGTWTLEASVKSPGGSATARYSLTVGNRGLTKLDEAGAGGRSGPGSDPQAGPEDGKAAYYTCPMHPHVKQHGPGPCPICGMDLVRVFPETASESGVVSLDPGQARELGVRSDAAVKRPLSSEIRVVGRVTFDETRLADVTVKFGGYIGRLYAEETGGYVKKGQTLFTLYSPELYAAQQEYLVALASQRAAQGSAAPDRADYLVNAARQKLRLWDLEEWQIRQLAQEDKPVEQVPVTSPASGYVVEKDVVEGAAVTPGMRLFRIAGLDRVWVEAAVYESELPRVRVGQPAVVTLPSVPGEEIRGRVSLILPALNPETRTGRVRIAVANRPGPNGLLLRPDMYTDVRLMAEGRDALMVPESAVLYTGPRRLVFLDLGEGRFEQREVTLGARSGDFYEVLSGLQEGDRVVTSGNFLVDAEARLRTGGPVEGGDDAGH